MMDSSAMPDQLPFQALRGIELFNRGEYFEAHEALEAAWREEKGPVRELYRGILQAGVAYLHLLRGNYRGARKLIGSALRWLELFPPEALGVDVAGLRANLREVNAELMRLGPQGIGAFNRHFLKPVIVIRGE